MVTTNDNLDSMQFYQRRGSPVGCSMRRSGRDETDPEAGHPRCGLLEGPDSG
ncbi:hypothetical protein [Rhodococcus opacus]|uniref:hypothetical protein n=1 Tax=Rhodococcus opacus TaxID=37919 RepID=UPI002E0E123E